MFLQRESSIGALTCSPCSGYLWSIFPSLRLLMVCGVAIWAMAVCDKSAYERNLA